MKIKFKAGLIGAYLIDLLCLKDHLEVHPADWVISLTCCLKLNR